MHIPLPFPHIFIGRHDNGVYNVTMMLWEQIKHNLYMKNSKFQAGTEFLKIS